ncbi:MAG TPA: ATP-binding protein [Mycobacterium sp.]|nr:ATP-binding protein [Mycobacterium sp.]
MISIALAAVADRYQAKKVALTSHIATELPHVRADPQHLAQVLGNLLNNALRHTPPHGWVDVVATADTADLTIVVGRHRRWGRRRAPASPFRNGSTAWMPPRGREHGGAGIGLAIAKAIVNAHGGHISASSRGPGTRNNFHDHTAYSLLLTGWPNASVRI